MTQNQTPELQGHSPVAYFALHQPMKGDPHCSSTHDGKVDHFVNEEVKQAFDRNPDKYIPAYGGLCAFGMSIDKEFESCPTNFKIINDKLHLFHKNDETDALELWNKEDQAKCLNSADKHWSARRSQSTTPTRLTNSRLHPRRSHPCVSSPNPSMRTSITPWPLC